MAEVDDVTGLDPGVDEQIAFGRAAELDDEVVEFGEDGFGGVELAGQFVREGEAFGARGGRGADGDAVLHPLGVERGVFVVGDAVVGSFGRAFAEFFGEVEGEFAHAGEGIGAGIAQMAGGEVDFGGVFDAVEAGEAPVRGAGHGVGVLFEKLAQGSEGERRAFDVLTLNGTVFGECLHGVCRFSHCGGEAEWGFVFPDEEVFVLVGNVQGSLEAAEFVHQCILHSFYPFELVFHEPLPGLGRPMAAR